MRSRDREIVFLVLAVCLGCSARSHAASEIKRHASAYIYDHGRPVEPLEKSQFIIRGLAMQAGHSDFGGGLMTPVLILDLFATDHPDRMLWPHAAGVDTVWYRELPEPRPGERSFVLVGKVGRGIPDSVRVECAAESFSLAVKRRKP